MSNEPNIYIKVERKIIDGNELCESSLYGDVFTLSSLLFSAMLSNPKFANIVIEAANCYMAEKIDKRAILN